MAERPVRRRLRGRRSLSPPHRRGRPHRHSLRRGEPPPRDTVPPLYGTSPTSSHRTLGHTAEPAEAKLIRPRPTPLPRARRGGGDARTPLRLEVGAYPAPRHPGDCRARRPTSTGADRCRPPSAASASPRSRFRERAGFLIASQRRDGAVPSSKAADRSRARRCKGDRVSSPAASPNYFNNVFQRSSELFGLSPPEPPAERPRLPDI